MTMVDQSESDAKPATHWLTNSPTFRAMGRHRNFRLWVYGQLISLPGTFMQVMAQAWLVVELTGSKSKLGLVVAVQYLPLLILGSFAALIVDRLDRRVVLIWTQAIAGALALTMWILVVTDVVRLWMVFALALGLGLVTALDQPVRGAIVLDLVGREDLGNAIGLNNAMFAVGRAAGPAIGGLTIVVFGLSACFLFNAVSYLGVIYTLTRMRASELRVEHRATQSRGQLAEVLRYIRTTPEARALLAALAFVSGIAWEFDVTLALLTRFTFDRDSTTFAVLSSMLGVGALCGALTVARRTHVTRRLMLGLMVALSVVMVIASLAPSVYLMGALVVLCGATGAPLIVVGSTILQSEIDPTMRARVMAIWAVAVVGTRPIGGPIVGYLAEIWSPRWALGLTGAGVALIALPMYLALANRLPPRLTPAGATSTPAATATDR
jgi:MFS family permease